MELKEGSSQVRSSTKLLTHFFVASKSETFFSCSESEEKVRNFSTTGE